ncbi:MAG: ATP-binding protein [Candidatus Hydrogenedentes bacterium]|nr:ATP-binding protein [Candidatus Hydrogenedentota bacterium]
MIKACAQFPAVVLTGARQAGKTSLVRHLFPEAGYVSLDIPQEAESARMDALRFVARHPEPLIIDEVQYVPELLRHLKTLIDEDRRAGRFILTGSQDFSLMEGAAESMAGRCAVLSLGGLSLAEAGQHAGPDLIDTYLWRGGYPELWQRPELDRDLWLGSYLATYLERDVRNIVQVGSLRDFDRFLRAVALRAGKLLSVSELARDVGISVNTGKAWLSILEASRQIFLLEPYHVNAGKRLVKTPKLYFHDPGLLSYLLGFLHPSAIRRSAAWGPIWENLVIAEVWKYFQNHGKRPPCWFWRVNQGEEVDLLIEIAPNAFVALECKAAAFPERSALKGIQALGKAYGARAMRHAALVCTTGMPYPLSEDGLSMALPLDGQEGLIPWLDSLLRDGGS